MYTKQIDLEEVTLDEFERMEDFWGKRRKKNSIGILSKVSTPIIETSYEELIYKICLHPRASIISVNLRGTWLKMPARDMEDEDFQRFAEIAANDRYKRNYLEVKLQKGSKDHRSVIGFTEWKGRIIGYELSLNADHEYMFRTSSSGPYLYNNGLWVPEGWQEKTKEDEFPDDVFSRRVEF